MNSRFLLSIAAVLLVLSLAFSAEKMLCGFEPEELVSWPNLTILDTNGNDIGYGGPASVGFMVSRDTLEATQGGYVFKNQIYPGVSRTGPSSSMTGTPCAFPSANMAARPTGSARDLQIYSPCITC